MATVTTPTTPSLPAATNACTTNVAMDLELEPDSPRPTASPRIYDHVMELRHISPPAEDVPNTAAVLAFQRPAVWDVQPEPPHTPFAPIPDMEDAPYGLVSLAEQQPIAPLGAGTVYSISSDSGSELDDSNGSSKQGAENERAGNAGMHSVFKRLRHVLTLRRSHSTKYWRRHHRYAL